MTKCNYPLNEPTNRKRWCPSASHTSKEQADAYIGLAFCSHHYRVMLAKFPLKTIPLVKVQLTNKRPDEENEEGGEEC